MADDSFNMSDLSLPLNEPSPEDRSQPSEPPLAHSSNQAPPSLANRVLSLPILVKQPQAHFTEQDKMPLGHGNAESAAGDDPGICQSASFALGFPVPQIDPVVFLSSYRRYLSGKRVCFLGDLPYPRSKKFFNTLLESVGGIRVDDVDEKTDYVICYQQLDGEKEVQQIRQAMLHGVRVLNYRFMDDIAIHGRIGSILEYRVDTRVLKLVGPEHVKACVDIGRIEFIDGCKMAMEDMGSEMWHLYRDENCFQWNVTLTRFRKDVNETELIKLRLYEHHVDKRLHCHAIFELVSPEGGCRVITSCHRGTLDLPNLPAAEFFRYIFKQATGYSWKWRHWGFNAEIHGEEKPSTGLAIFEHDPRYKTLYTDGTTYAHNLLNVDPVDRTKLNDMATGGVEVDAFAYKRTGSDRIGSHIKLWGEKMWGFAPRFVLPGGKWADESDY